MFLIQILDYIFLHKCTQCGACIYHWWRSRYNCPPLTSLLQGEMWTGSFSPWKPSAPAACSVQSWSRCSTNGSLAARNHNQRSVISNEIFHNEKKNHHVGVFRTTCPGMCFVVVGMKVHYQKKKAEKDRKTDGPYLTCPNRRTCPNRSTHPFWGVKVRKILIHESFEYM